MMYVKEAVKLAILATTIVWPGADAGTAGAVKLCGRKLSDIMSKVCFSYNSPSISVLEHHRTARQKREIGIADECCLKGCTWEQLNEYCAISADAVSASDPHTIADRSAEGSTSVAAEPAEPASPAAVGGVAGSGGTRREVGPHRSRGYGAKGRRCRCRRKRRSHRRRSFLMGNMGLIKNVVRAAPMVGTVSPLLTWGRTLNTDYPPISTARDQYAYIVYT